MKKTKFLLAAMALPMLFTACSQDELVENYGNPDAPKAEGFYATFNPGLDGVDSRATWQGAKLAWDETDKISLYWLGAEGDDVVLVDGTTPAKYQYNSIFKTTDGYSFNSESMVFLGGNVAVYPANESYYTGNETIVLSVADNQDASTINKIPYISNYLSIQKRTSQSGNNPGYNNGIDAPMKMAANVFNLTIDLKNTAGLSAYGFEVESVELHATNTSAVVADESTVTTGAFAKQANIVTSEREKYDTTGSTLTATMVSDPYYASSQDYWNGSAWKKAPTLTKNLWVDAVEASKVSKLTSTAITKNADGTYTAQFVVLPTNVAVTDAKIVINTTCGHVDIETPAVVTGVVDVKDTWIVKGGSFEDPTKTGATLEECLTAVVSDDYYKNYENVNAKFVGEKTGRVFPRSIVADMNNATLNNSAVYTSADIIRYVNIYNKMGKENTSDNLMNLILSSKSTSTTFAGLTKAALAAVDGENNYALGINKKINVTLSAGLASNGSRINAVEITDAGAVYDIKSFAGDYPVSLVLGTGAWTMNDVLDLNDKISKIVNKGTLTVNGTTHPTAYTQMSLVETIQNEGTLKIGGNGILQVPGNLTTGWTSSTEIAAGQNLIFTANITEGLNGTINVNAANAFLTTKTGVIVTNNGVINNYGTVAAEGNLESNGFINEYEVSPSKINGQYYYGGIINVKGEQAITYVYNNENGTINMLTRTDEIMVASALKGDIIYPYTAADGATFKYTIDDRFTSVKFGGDVANLTLVEPMDASDDNYDGSISFENISFIFTGTTTLKAAAAKDFAINNLTVNSGANLRVLTGNKLTVNDLTNNGLITIGGYIYYKNNHVAGRQLSQGGAIKKYEGVSYAQELINDAITAGGGTIVFDREIAPLTEALIFGTPSSRTEDGAIAPIEITLDLNGKTLKNDTGDVIVVGQGIKLTITGNGEVLGATTNKASSCAVWADGGEVIIENGYFAVGSDNALRNDCIYAKWGGKITINGGEFEYLGTVATDKQNTADDGNKYLLNLKDSNAEGGQGNQIIVNKGKFWRYNPAASTSEPGENQSFVQIPPATGSYATTVLANGTERPESRPTVNPYNYAWGNVYYTVK
ncbi:MAG: hypothetical protein IJB61_09160 [Bacteroides sp]|nr:hypothetical protein [Bacteroides sp.]